MLFIWDDCAKSREGIIDDGNASEREWIGREIRRAADPKPVAGSLRLT